MRLSDTNQQMKTTFLMPISAINWTIFFTYINVFGFGFQNAM